MAWRKRIRLKRCAVLLYGRNRKDNWLAMVKQLGRYGGDAAPIEKWQGSRWFNRKKTKQWDRKSRFCSQIRSVIEAWFRPVFRCSELYED